MHNYCEHIYDESTDGYIQTLSIDNNKKIKIYNTNIKNVREVVEEFQGQLDFFITPNTFFIPKREIKNIRQFRALFIDIDGCENDKQHVAYTVFEMAENKVIPKPTMIVDSGRGLHLYWRIENAPYQAYYTWQELEDYLYGVLKPLGADIRATDGARVLRLPGTINSRNDMECRVIWQDNDTEYSMYDLREEYLKHKYKKAISKAKKYNSKIVKNLFFSSYSLHMARAADLETIVKLRKGKMNTYRNMALHCYAYWKGIYVRNDDELKRVVEDFNNSFTNPLRDNEVAAVLRCIPKAIGKFLEYEQGLNSGSTKRVTKGMRDKGGYWYKNETLIEKLEITEKEQKHMSTIISKEEANEREKAKKKADRRNEKGLTKKQQELQDLKVKVLELKNQGLNNTQIANKLKVDRKKVSRLINS